MKKNGSVNSPRRRSFGVILTSLFAVVVCYGINVRFIKIFIGAFKTDIIKNFSYLVGKVGFFETIHTSLMSFLLILIGIGFGVSGIFLFMLKDWARKIFLILMVTLLLVFYEVAAEQPFDYLIIVIMNLGILYYFTRPKVKRQFMERNPEQSEG